jgi:hypothetical protein
MTITDRSRTPFAAMVSAASPQFHDVGEFPSVHCILSRDCWMVQAVACGMRDPSSNAKSHLLSDPSYYRALGCHENRCFCKCRFSVWDDLSPNAGQQIERL